MVRGYGSIKRSIKRLPINDANSRRSTPVGYQRKPFGSVGAFKNVSENISVSKKINFNHKEKKQCLDKYQKKNG